MDIKTNNQNWKVCPLLLYESPDKNIVKYCQTIPTPVRLAQSIPTVLTLVDSATALPLKHLGDTPNSESIGVIIAWLCATLYIISRVPQIVINHKRKSTSGVNILLFGAAFCGNSFYTASVLISPTSDSWEGLLNALPFLVGSAG